MANRDPQTAKPFLVRSEQRQANLDAENRVLRFCARMFEEPSHMVRWTRARFDHLATLTSHAHPDLIQLDLAVGCEGYWSCEGRKRKVEGITASVFYPHEVHGFEMRPVAATGEVLSLKLRVDESWPEVHDRIFPPLVQGITEEQPLVRSLQHLMRVPTTIRTRPSGLLVALASALCLWPTVKDSRARENDSGVERSLFRGEYGPDPLLERVFNIIDARLDDPPTIEELADEVHFSPRHLTRRFRQYCGSSVHRYITSRRLERASELLLQGQLSVSEVAKAVGFVSIYSFSRWFHQQTGVPPSQYSASQFML